VRDFIDRHGPGRAPLNLRCVVVDEARMESKPAHPPRQRGGIGLLAWVLLGLPLGIAARTRATNEASGTLTTRWGTWWGRHPRLLHALVALALCWTTAYLTWRVGWSEQGSNPLLWAMLLLAEAYGCWNLVMLSWLTWDIRSGPRPAPTPGRAVDVYICTYDEPLAVLEATLAGCALLNYPHTTYLLDDGRRAEVESLAQAWEALYLTRPDNSHAKAGNINHALTRTEGELVFVLDADHVPLPDALQTLVGYFDDPRVALVQSPHDFSNHDSVQHYDLGRHEQSVFFSAICPGKDRHNAAFWCGSGALIGRAALLGVGGVATETIAEDFHTTIKLHRAGWLTHYDKRVVVQGRAPHDLAAYLLQRDRWARGNLAVFTTPESPLRGHGLTTRQRLSYLASLTAYLAGPARIVILAVLVEVLWTGALPLHIAPLALALLWGPATLLMVLAGSALCRGQQGNGETTHYELCTAEIFIRALRCVVRPGHGGFRVTPKEGVDHGGWEAVRQFRLLLVCVTLLAAGLILRIAADAGLGVLPPMRGFAAWFVPLLGLFELRRILRTLTLVGRHRQLRGEYRTPLAASVAIGVHSAPGSAVETASGELASGKIISGEIAPGQTVLGHTCDITPSGIAVELSRPLPLGSRASLALPLPGVQASTPPPPIRLDVTVQACRPQGELWRIGASIASCSDEDRHRIIEYCHVTWPYQRLRGFRPAPLAPISENAEVGDAIVRTGDAAGDASALGAVETLQSTG
jgi:cellulose synthase (UDP-forming)